MSLLSRNILVTLSAYCLICALVLPLSGLPLLDQESSSSNSNKDSGLDGLLKQNENTNDQIVADELMDEASAADNDEQRTLASYYLALYLQELLNNGGAPVLGDEQSSSNDDRYISASGSNKLMEKRASVRSTLIKKESPFEQQRNKEMRRQQTARWDIGFGKRAYKPKAFMDALYGKRSNLFYKQTSPKLAYGRKQQWDIQYGRR